MKSASMSDSVYAYGPMLMLKQSRSCEPGLKEYNT